MGNIDEVRHLLLLSDAIIYSKNEFKNKLINEEYERSLLILNKMLEGLKQIESLTKGSLASEYFLSDINNHSINLKRSFKKSTEQIQTLINHIENNNAENIELKKLINEVIDDILKQLDLFISRWKRSLELNVKPILYKHVIKTNNSSKANIALMDVNKDDSEFKRACAYVAHFEKVNFFYFTPSDVDFNNKQIHGYTLNNDTWKQKIFVYPDVIHDRIRMKGFPQLKKLYDEFYGIPITSELMGDSMDKLEAYGRIFNIKNFNNYLIPYSRINSLDTIFYFLETFNKIIIKPIKGSFGKNIIYIGKTLSNNYEVIKENKKHTISHNEISEAFKNFPLKKFLVQRYINSCTPEGFPFDIRVHLFKNKQFKWEIGKILVRIGRSLVTNFSSGGSGCELPEFLSRYYDKKTCKELNEELEKLCLSFAPQFEETLESNLNELGLDLAMDENKKFWIIEVNVNLINYRFHHIESARRIIPYTNSIVEFYKNN